MTFEMQEILKSKNALRKRLTLLPFADKLRLLEELRERSLSIGANPLRKPKLKSLHP